METDHHKQRAYDLILGESDRLRRLVESLLDFGRMQARQYKYRTESLEAVEWSRSVAEEFRETVRGKIKQNLRKYITQGEMLGKKGKEVVSIPLPQIDIPHFRFGNKQTGGVAQGDGNPGDPVGAEEGEGSGSGKAFRLDRDDRAQSSARYSDTTPHRSAGGTIQRNQQHPGAILACRRRALSTGLRGACYLARTASERDRAPVSRAAPMRRVAAKRDEAHGRWRDGAMTVAANLRRALAARCSGLYRLTPFCERRF